MNSKSFYTTTVQHRALREGAVLAKKLGESEAATKYVEQADNLLCFLQVCFVCMPRVHLSFINNTCSLTGIPRKVISRRTLVVEDQALTPIPLWLQFTLLMQLLDVMPLPSNLALTKHFPA